MGDIGSNTEKEYTRTGQIDFKRSGERKGRLYWVRKKVEHEKTQAVRVRSE